jgi:hypothetical protein
MIVLLARYMFFHGNTMPSKNRTTFWRLYLSKLVLFFDCYTHRCPSARSGEFEPPIKTDNIQLISRTKLHYSFE